MLLLSLAARTSLLAFLHGLLGLLLSVRRSSGPEPPLPLILLRIFSSFDILDLPFFLS